MKIPTDSSFHGCSHCNLQHFKTARLAKLENKTMVDASLDACADVPKATSSYWEGKSGEVGLVLCLAPVEPVAAPAPAVETPEVRAEVAPSETEARPRRSRGRGDKSDARSAEAKPVAAAAARDVRPFGDADIPAFLRRPVSLKA